MLFILSLFFSLSLPLPPSPPQGHEKEALNLMSSYLPKDSPNSSPYAEGGGLYAIGEKRNHSCQNIEFFTFFSLQV
jgi:hypothetical protein